MAYKLNLKFKGKCPRHPRFNPENADYPQKGCDICDGIWVVYRYGQIVQKKIEWLGEQKATTQVPVRKHKKATQTNKEQETK